MINRALPKFETDGSLEIPFGVAGSRDENLSH
jgi:hypothetical protein